MQQVLTIEGLSKRFGKKNVLTDVNLTIDKGECLGLIGKNGSGKSTLINIIIDVVKPDSGSILIFDEYINDEQVEVKKKIGVLPEFNPVIEEFSLQDYLEYVGLIYQLDKELIKTRSEYLIDYFFEEEPDQKKSIGQFSKGMKMKTGLCAALIHKPEFLILDEPFDGMDMFSSKNLVEFLNDYRERGNTILVSSHDMLFMERIVTKVSVIKEDILQTISKEEILLSGEGFEEYVAERMGYNPKEIKEFS